MALIIKYTKSQYNAKITELEGYYEQLKGHLDTMNGLKEKMFEFWDDPNAQTTGQLLAIEIRSVSSAMDRTKDTINFYKSTVEKMDGANLNVSDMLGDALGLLSNLGL